MWVAAGDGCFMLRSMDLIAEDRLEIYELLSLHGHLIDAGSFDRLDELFTEDFVYDLEAFGRGRLVGAEAFAEVSRAVGDDNPLGHHVTNPVVIENSGGEAIVRSKGIGVLAGGGVHCSCQPLRRDPAGPTDG